MRTYVTGFILSLLLTLSSFGLVAIHVSSEHESLPHEVLIPTIVVLAITQLAVQLMFFLHLGREPKPKLHLVSFLFMLLVITIVVAGSLWIMANLNYNMMHDHNIEHEIIEDEGIHHH